MSKTMKKDQVKNEHERREQEARVRKGEKSKAKLR